MPWRHANKLGLFRGGFLSVAQSRAAFAGRLDRLCNHTPLSFQPWIEIPQPLCRSNGRPFGEPHLSQADPMQGPGREKRAAVFDRSQVPWITVPFSNVIELNMAYIHVCSMSLCKVIHIQVSSYSGWLISITSFEGLRRMIKQLGEALVKGIFEGCSQILDGIEIRWLRRHYHNRDLIFVKEIENFYSLTMTWSIVLHKEISVGVSCYSNHFRLFGRFEQVIDKRE